jgi:phosphohistidine phosphatase SixA
MLMLSRMSAAAACLLAAVCLLTLANTARADTADELWAAVRDGRAFAIMRHALAPGVGDPENLQIGDCTTQRNLSAEGRAQARAIGARFQANGIGRADVYSSAWCRCRDTAEELRLGKVKILTPLNSFFRDWSRREPQTKALKDWLAAYAGTGPLVLVTHQVNISALTGRGTRSGEIVVARLGPDKDVTVLGSLETQP